MESDPVLNQTSQINPGQLHRPAASLLDTGPYDWAKETGPIGPTVGKEANRNITERIFITSRIGSVAVGVDAPEAGHTDRPDLNNDATERLASPFAHGERGAIDFSKFTLSSLRRGIAESRLRRAEERVISPDVHKEAAQAISEHRTPVPELRPITSSQRRQALRADRRQRAINVRRSRDQYNLENIYGDEVSNPHLVISERLTRADKKSEARAVKLYAKNEKFIQKRSKKMKKSVEGEDIPGRIVSSRVNRAHRQANNLRDRL